MGAKGIDRVEWILREYLQKGLLTVDLRKNMFYGMGLTGMGLDDNTPDVLEFL